MPDFVKDRLAASAWARNLLANPDSFCILDFETTGLPQDNPEIVQIGLLWGDGTPALDCLVRPLDGVKIPVGATAIHGITDAMVAPGKAAPLSQILPTMAEIIANKTVVVYNLSYDFEVLLGCLLRRDWERSKVDGWLMSALWDCAMKQYAAWWGDWNDYRQNYRWQKLPGGDHTAIGDCRATYDILRRMAAEVEDVNS